ncbi:MAG: hypothetical protein JXQ89_11540 [Pelagimonas sp.]
MHKQDPSIAEMTQMSVRVAELYSQHFGAPRDARFALMKLSEEMGELTGAWLQLHGQSRGAANTQDLENELADVLGFLLVLAHREGIDPAQALSRKWGKYLNAGA